MPGYDTTTTTTTTTVPETTTTTITVEVGEPPVPVDTRPENTTPSVSHVNAIPVDATPIYSTPPVCTEDMDCWDCETMGNMICGTISTDNSSNYPSALPATGGSLILLAVALIFVGVGKTLTRIGR